MEQTKQESPAQDEEQLEEVDGKPERVRNKYADRFGGNRRKLPKWLGRTIGLLCLAALIGGAVYLVHRVNSSAQDTDAGSQTVVATRQPLETYVEGNGTTAAKTTSAYGKNIKGQVQAVRVGIGSQVKAGDVLFTVDPKEMQKDLDTATTALNDAARAVDDAASALAKAKKDVGNLTITAPFSGKILPAADSDGNTKSFRAGQDLSEGTVLGTMVDDSVMRLPLYFNYAYINRIKAGQKTTVSVPVSMSTVSGSVSSVQRVQKVSDDGAMLFRAVITLKNPGALKGGMVATAAVSVGTGQVLPADSGKLEYNRSEEITARGAGEIISVAELDNYRYSTGAVLCRLSNDTYQTAIGTAQRTLEAAQSALQTKQQELADIRQHIADCTVTAKIDGVVTDLKVTDGQTLDGSADVCTVSNLSSIVVHADVSELDVDKVQAGMDALITMDQDNSITLNGKVLSVSMQADTASASGGGGQQSGARMFPAVIAVSADGEVPPDRSVSYKIVCASKEDCLVVPTTAIVYTDTGSAVYAKQAESKKFAKTLPLPQGSDVPQGYVLVPVETGISDESNTEIVSGIDEGTEVYLAGPQDVNNQANGDGGAAATAVPAG